MSRICIVGGGGYVGLGYAVALAELGHDVVGLDIDEGRVALLNRGEPPLFEAGLTELLTGTLAAGRLRFTADYAAAVPDAEFVFLCTGTPSLSDGEADLRQVRAAAAAIGAHLAPGRRTVVVNKSTMPIGSAEVVAALVAEHAPAGADFRVVSNPEFLREGRVVEDIRHPDRIVLGADDPAAAAAVAKLYEPLGAPILVTDHRSAEMIKYAANAFLATKISFVNEVARLCERLGADVTIVAEGMGLDPRIGPRFLHAGLGFGGSCFPKDVGALTRMADDVGLHPGLLRAVLEINADVRRRFVARVHQLLGGLDGRVMAVWGLAFKEDTDDLRESPALAVIEMLRERGAVVRAHDPAALANAAARLPADVALCANPYAAAAGADAVLLCTPWRQYREVDLARVAAAMRGDLLLDGRNLLDPSAATAAGLRYEGIGRGRDRLPMPSSRHAPAVHGGTGRPAPGPAAGARPRGGLAGSGQLNGRGASDSCGKGGATAGKEGAGTGEEGRNDGARRPKLAAVAAGALAAGQRLPGGSESSRRRKGRQSPPVQRSGARHRRDGRPRPPARHRGRVAATGHGLDVMRPASRRAGGAVVAGGVEDRQQPVPAGGRGELLGLAGGQRTLVESAVTDQ